MGLIEQRAGEGSHPVAADALNFRGTLDAVGTGTVGRYIEGLIGVLGPIETISNKYLILAIQRVVAPAKDGSVPLLVDHR